MGIQCITESMQLAEKLDEKKMLLNNFKQMIFYGIQVEDFVQVEEYVQKGLRYLQKEEKATEESGVFMRLLGCYFLHKGEYTKAEKTLIEAMKVFRECAKGKAHFNMSIAACQGYLGDLSRCQGDLEMAAVYYERAIEMGQGKVVTNGLGQFYSGMGQIFYLQNKDKEARQYLEKAISCLKRHGYYWGLERAQIYMAMLLKRQNSFEEAKAYYKESRQISEKIKNPTTMELLRKFEEDM